MIYNSWILVILIMQLFKITDTDRKQKENCYGKSDF